jgi:hypothetical protein
MSAETNPLSDNPQCDCKKPFLLICVEKPRDNTREHSNAWAEWHALIEDTKPITTSAKGVEKLAENIWLFPITAHMTSAIGFLSYCENHHITRKVFFLENKPNECK